VKVARDENWVKYDCELLLQCPPTGVSILPTSNHVMCCPEYFNTPPTHLIMPRAVQNVLISSPGDPNQLKLAGGSFLERPPKE
jgi:hypothetical protein